jgi:integrase
MGMAVGTGGSAPGRQFESGDSNVARRGGGDMARELARLSVKKAQTARPVGKVTKGRNKGQPRTAVLLCDGGGLYVQCSTGADGNIRRSWIFRYQRSKHEKKVDMGLGSVNDLPLAEAREIARKYRLLLAAGQDPIRERNIEIARNLAVKGAMTFDEAAAQYIATHRSSWKNKSHSDQWPSSLATYVSPKIGRMPVGDIDTEHVMACLSPIWTDKPETGSRVRQRIEMILGWAGAQGLRKDEHGHDLPNSARWKGHLKNLLPAPTKVRKRKHQPALPYSAMPAFVRELRTKTGIGPLALEFAILTGVRTQDVRLCKRSCIDHDKRMWTIPEFSKTGVEHRVPLSKSAVAVIKKVTAMVDDIGGAVGKSEYLFANDITGKPLSENALLAVINRMDLKGKMSTHGCRASFRTFLQEETNFPHELAELSLGHKVGDETTRAYMRGDGLKRRFAVMETWASFLERPLKSGEVVTFARTNA